MQLIQIPFSHNCIKVRRTLELKGLNYDVLDISPMDREPVFAATGQRLVPALVDGDRTISDSTEILRYLERQTPRPSLLPDDAADHAACWLLVDWADRALMAVTRRLAYWQVINTPGTLARLFFPTRRGLARGLMTLAARRAVTRRFRLSAERNARDRDEVRRAARLALERLAGRDFLFGDRAGVADVTLASMAAPLLAAGEQVGADDAIRDLLAWAEPILGDDVAQLYRPLRSS
ncbi:MAG: glutathione S-transferase family protein [bacterium]|nr:glutathione S-transferase family protein [bacterium]